MVNGFEIKKFEHVGSLSDFLKMLYKYFKDKGWDTYEEILLPLETTSTQKDQLVKFSVIKKEIVLTINTDWSEDTSVSNGYRGVKLYITCQRKKYNFKTNTDVLYPCLSEVAFSVNNAIYYSNYTLNPYKNNYFYQCYIHYKENDSILFCNLFPDTYYKAENSQGFGFYVYQPIIKTFNSQYVNNLLCCGRLDYDSSDGYYSSNYIKLDTDFTSLATKTPIQQTSNILDNQLLLVKNIELYDTITNNFLGTPLGIIGVHGAAWTRFYNINDKKYFCFAPNLLICCEDEDDLTPVLPEDAEVIDMAPKPTE